MSFSINSGSSIGIFKNILTENIFVSGTAYLDSQPVVPVVPGVPASSSLYTLNQKADGLTKKISSVSIMTYSSVNSSNILATIDAPLSIKQSFTFGTRNRNMWVAVGQRTGTGTACIATSFDGITWTARTDANVVFGVDGSVYTIAWNGSIWIAGGLMDGTGTACIATSLDGITWTARTDGNVAFGDSSVNAIEWNGSIWVAGGGGVGSRIATSSNNGITWILRNSNTAFGASGEIAGIAWNGLSWVACGIGFGTGTSCIATSPDGVLWTPRTNANTAFGLGGKVYSIAWNGSIWVGGSGGGTSYIATSPDGVVWTPSPNANTAFGSGGYVLCLAWNGSIWVGCGERGFGTGIACIATSPDGVIWTPRTNANTAFGTDGIVYTIEWNGTMWVAGGQRGGTGIACVATSPDGVIWTSRTNANTAFGTDGNVYTVTWNNSFPNTITFFPQLNVVCGHGVGVGTAHIATSPDGISWTPRIDVNIAFGTGGIIRDVKWNGIIWVACGIGDGTSGTSCIATSSDNCVTWTPRTDANTAFGSSGIVNKIEWNGSIWVACGIGVGTGTACISTSLDGILWKPSVGANVAFGIVYGILWNGSIWFAGGQRNETGASTACIATSLDGISWTPRTNATVAFGSSGKVYDLAWTGSLCVAVGYRNGAPGTACIATSSDNGVTWTARTNANTAFGPSGIVYGIAWNGLIWVACGYGDGTPGTACIATSSDNGVTWTARTNANTAFGPSGIVTGIVWSDSIWIACSTTYIATSEDSISWTRRANTSFGTGYSHALGSINTIIGVVNIPTTNLIVGDIVNPRLSLTSEYYNESFNEVAVSLLSN